MNQEETWPKCGHPKTPENTAPNGRGAPHRKIRYACRLCRQEIDARYKAKLKKNREIYDQENQSHY